MTRLPSAALLAVLAGCAGKDVDLTEPTGDARVVDNTVAEDDLGELGAEDVVLAGPAVTIEPGQDVMVCLFGTWRGGDVGLHEIHAFQGKYGHHFQLMGTSTPELDAPDGTVVDCNGDGSDSFQMASLEPLGLPNFASVDGVLSELEMPLPEGMAVELEDGQRYVLQSHYLNTGPDPIRVEDKVVLRTVATEAVETWAAPLIFNRDDFSIPAGGTLETSFDCTAESDWNLLYMLGHMHEWGSAFSVQRREPDDSWSEFYAVPEWDPVYRDAPKVQSSVDAPIAIHAGDTFKTTCAWENDGDHALEFPHEMCVTVAFVYPQKTTIVCDGNGQ